jgi:hypothetical protein
MSSWSSGSPALHAVNGRTGGEREDGRIRDEWIGEDDVELILNIAMIFYLVNLLDYLIELDDFFILTKRYNL